MCCGEGVSIRHATSVHQGNPGHVPRSNGSALSHQQICCVKCMAHWDFMPRGRSWHSTGGSGRLPETLGHDLSGNPPPSFANAFTCVQTNQAGTAGALRFHLIDTGKASQQSDSLGLRLLRSCSMLCATLRSLVPAPRENGIAFCQCHQRTHK